MYKFVRAGWTENKGPDKMEDDYDHIFDKEEYTKRKKYSDQELLRLMPPMGEIDASIQVTFSRGGHAITLAQINLLHNGFSRRSWLKPGADLYKGNGRVKHEAHKIHSGPFQTVVIDSRQANDKHDRAKPSTDSTGTDNHFERAIKYADCGHLDRRCNMALPGIYSEYVKRGVLWEAVEFLRDVKPLPDLTSNLYDHAVPASIMSAAYISHIRRSRGLDSVVPIEITYEADDLAKPHIPETFYQRLHEADVSSASSSTAAVPAMAEPPAAVSHKLP
ncbi:MAG: hypothetical protein M1818_007190 [Claussenomyces sp. TS43310]|nr:MAG: hypothetical protein M1818_007190 [Claussenomyces sp. TS43310]